jgi:hypothetical protein
MLDGALKAFAKICLLASPLLSIRTSEYKNPRAAELMFMKFYIGQFYKNLFSRNNFRLNCTKISETLHAFLRAEVTG